MKGTAFVFTAGIDDGQPRHLSGMICIPCTIQEYGKSILIPTIITTCLKWTKK